MQACRLVWSDPSDAVSMTGTARAPHAWRPRHATDVLQRSCADEVLVCTVDADVLVLAGLSAAIWTCSDGRSTVEQIVDRLADESGRDPALLRPDVDDVLRQLCRQGVLDEPVAGPTGQG